MRWTQDQLTDDRAKALLPAAQAGDLRVQGEIAYYCYAKFLPRLRRLAAKNPDGAVSVEDLENVYFEGCMDGVLKADGRGDDLYHIGQRGIWAAMSYLRTVRRITRVQARVWAGINEDGDSRDPITDAPDPTAVEAFGRAEDAIVAVQRVQVIANAPLKARAREAVAVIASGAAGDPRDLGFNARLAVQLGVSPQRASQVMSEIRSAVA